MLQLATAIGILGAVIIVGVILTGLSLKYKIPHLLFLILIGLLLGPVTKIFDPLSVPHFVEGLVLLTLVIVLFDSGFDIEFRALLKELGPALKLTLINILLIFVIVFPFLYFSGFTIEQVLLFCALLISTDITVIAPLLKTKKSHQKNILSLEAAINSVIAILLAAIVSEVLQTGSNVISAVVKTVLFKVLVGIALGVFFGYILVFILKQVKVQIRPDIIGLGAILLVYAISEFLGASGIFAVFVCGMIFGNARAKVTVHRIRELESTVALLLTIFIYVTLGASLNLQTFLSIGWLSILIVMLTLIVRPISVKLAQLPNMRFFSFLQPRGMTTIALLFYYGTYFDRSFAFGTIFLLVVVSIILANSISFIPKTSKNARIDIKH